MKQNSSQIISSLLQAFGRILVHMVAPPRCAACGDGLESDTLLCAVCTHSVEETPSVADDVTASFAYGGAIAEAIKSVKYGRQEDGLYALERLSLIGLPNVSFDWIVPVPAHQRRVIERGFDQSARLAHFISRQRKIPLKLNVLTRVKYTERLATLREQEREQEVEHAFLASPKVRQKRILLIDDVTTTGATLRACMRALRAQGADVRAHVLAATPRFHVRPFTE